MLNFQYLDHSGFLVETDNNYLLFDYYTHNEDETLEMGTLNLAELKADKPLAIFVSHSHYDHYNKIVHSWNTERPGTLLFLADDIPPDEDSITIRPGKDLTLEGIRVRALRSTDQGVAFLVTVDGVTVYHAGDLNWWHWMGEDEGWLTQVDLAYTREIDKLKGEKIDLAFVPVDPRLEQTALWGAQYFMKTIGAGHLVPMHFWKDFSICRELVDHPESKAFAEKIIILSHRGQQVSL